MSLLHVCGYVLLRLSLFSYLFAHSVLSKVLNLPVGFDGDVEGVLRSEPTTPLKSKVLAQFLLKRACGQGKSSTGNTSAALFKSTGVAFYAIGQDAFLAHQHAPSVTLDVTAPTPTLLPAVIMTSLAKLSFLHAGTPQHVSAANGQLHVLEAFEKVGVATQSNQAPTSLEAFVSGVCGLIRSCDRCVPMFELSCVVLLVIVKCCDGVTARMTSWSGRSLDSRQCSCALKSNCSHLNTRHCCVWSCGVLCCCQNSNGRTYGCGIVFRECVD